MISFLICFLDFICDTKNFLTLSSREFFMRDVSIIIFGDCFKAFLSKCSNEFALADLGDFISNSIPSSKIFAVCRFDSLRNLISCLAMVKISATLISCGHNLRPDAMKVPFFDYFSYKYYKLFILGIKIVMFFCFGFGRRILVVNGTQKIRIILQLRFLVNNVIKIVLKFLRVFISNLFML